MITAGIAIERWKLPVFQKNLKDNGYSWTEHPGLTADTMLLKVQTEYPGVLAPVVEKAQRECLGEV